MTGRLRAERRAVSAAGGWRSLVDVGGEAVVDEAHDHRSLADRGGATLDRSRADIADREDTGHARLEEALGAGLLAGEDEAVVVERDGAAEPVGVRRGSEEEEEGGERDPFAVAEGRRFELAVGAVQLGDLASFADERRRRGRGRGSGSPTSSRRRSARRWRSVTSAPPRASQIAAWAAELPPPTTPTRVAPQRRASCGPGGVEDADAFVRLDLGDRKPAVVGAGREYDGARRHLVAARRAGRGDARRRARARRPGTAWPCGRRTSAPG